MAWVVFKKVPTKTAAQRHACVCVCGHRSPHTNSSWLTANTLLPFSICGWAQLALTEGRKVCSATQTGSHFSWQSHSRLEVLRPLSERDREREIEKEERHTPRWLGRARESDRANRVWIAAESQNFDPAGRIPHLKPSSAPSETAGKREPVVNNEVSAVRRLSQQTIMAFTGGSVWCEHALPTQRKTNRLTAPAGS